MGKKISPHVCYHDRCLCTSATDFTAKLAFATNLEVDFSLTPPYAPRSRMGPLGPFCWHKEIKWVCWLAPKGTACSACYSRCVWPPQWDILPWKYVPWPCLLQCDICFVSLTHFYFLSLHRDNSYTNTVVDLSHIIYRRLKIPVYHSDFIYWWSSEGRRFRKACRLAHDHTGMFHGCPAFSFGCCILRRMGQFRWRGV